jgi:two-component system, response regulator
MIALRENRLVNEVLAARDGEEAIEILKGDENFALVLLDLQLPKIDGQEVLRFIRSKNRRVPVVILTSSDEDQDIVESYDLGANSYVRKPVAFDEFLEATRQLGMYWLLLNASPSNRSSS